MNTHIISVYLEKYIINLIVGYTLFFQKQKTSHSCIFGIAPPNKYSVYSIPFF